MRKAILTFLLIAPLLCAFAQLSFAYDQFRDTVSDTLGKAKK